MMNPETPALGVRFNIDLVGGGSYGTACWEIFWRAVDPVKLAGAALYEGDSAASIGGHENVFCLVIQTTDAGALGFVKAALSNHMPFNDVCAPPRFIEGQKCKSEPLVNAGTVGSEGQIHGDSWNAKPGLDAARLARATTKRAGTAATSRVEKLFVQWDFAAVQELERMSASLPVVRRSQAVRFFASAASAAAAFAQPIERESGSVFESLMGVIASSDRKDFGVWYDLTPNQLGTGILAVETYDATIGVLFCVARLADSSFLTHAFVKRHGTRDAILTAFNRPNSESTQSESRAHKSGPLKSTWWRWWK